jgi:hypothetical protein
LWWTDKGISSSICGLIRAFHLQYHSGLETTSSTNKLGSVCTVTGYQLNDGGSIPCMGKDRVQTGSGAIPVSYIQWEPGALCPVKGEGNRSPPSSAEVKDS